MRYPLKELARLSSILEAESTGQPFDPDEAKALAEMLAELCPTIESTMHLVMARMDLRQNADAA